jgi:hypothetical protein
VFNESGWQYFDFTAAKGELKKDIFVIPFSADYKNLLNRLQEEMEGNEGGEGEEGTKKEVVDVLSATISERVNLFVNGMNKILGIALTTLRANWDKVITGNISSKEEIVSVLFNAEGLFA